MIRTVKPSLPAAAAETPGVSRAPKDDEQRELLEDYLAGHRGIPTEEVAAVVRGLDIAARTLIEMEIAGFRGANYTFDYDPLRMR